METFEQALEERIYIEDLVPEALPEAVDELYRRAMKLLGEMEEEKRHVWVKIKK